MFLKLTMLRKIALVFVLLIITAACNDSAKFGRPILWQNKDDLMSINVTDLKTNTTINLSEERRLLLVEQLSNVHAHSFKVIEKLDVEARYQVNINQSNYFVSLYFNEIHQMRLRDSSYVINENTFSLSWLNQIFEEEAVKMPTQPVLSSYLHIPETFDYSLFTSAIMPKSMNGCSYYNIFQLEASEAVHQCGLTPSIIQEDRKTLDIVKQELPWLDDLLGQLYDALLEQVTLLDQQYSHLLSFMELQPITSYRSRDLKKQYSSRIQCGYDIGPYRFEELLADVDHIVLVEVSGDSTTFYRAERWPNHFDPNSDMMESSFLFEVITSYYGSMVPNDVGEFIYRGGIVDDVLEDCSGLYEEFYDGEKVLLFLSDDYFLEDSIEPIALYRETHYLHDSTLKLNTNNQLTQIKEKRFMAFFNPNVSLEDMAEYLNKRMRLVNHREIR